MVRVQLLMSVSRGHELSYMLHWSGLVQYLLSLCSWRFNQSNFIWRKVKIMNKHLNINPFWIHSFLRLPRSGTSVAPPFLSWQVITIIILLLLIFILIVTIFALISKLQAAKRRIKTAKLQVIKATVEHPVELYSFEYLQASARNATHPNNPHQDDTSHLYDLYSPTTNANKDMIVKTDRSSGKHYSSVYNESQQRSDQCCGSANVPGTSPNTGQAVYCESPSSGFGSEASKYSTNDLHADTTGINIAFIRFQWIFLTS